MWCGIINVNKFEFDEVRLVKKTNKNTNMGMALGMCFGVALGSAFAGTLSHGNIAMGTSIGLSLGLLIGLVIGSLKDKVINEQIEEKGYTIKAIDKNENGKEYRITVVSKSGEEVIVNIPVGIMETETFSVGNVVFLDDEGHIEQAFDEEEE